MNPARLAAARVLIAVERGRTTLSAEAERERADIPAPRDRALFLEIAAGTLRWQAELDACIAAHIRRGVLDLTPELRATLRSGSYQLLHLDRVPAHAAVSESVEVVRALGQPKATSFANAVLRKVASRTARRTLPRKPTNTSDTAAFIRYLSISLSHPAWLVERWLHRYGFEGTEYRCTYNNTPPSIAIRAIAPLSTDDLRARLVANGIRVSGGTVPDALRLPAGALGKLADEDRRSFRIQDEGSQLIALATGVKTDSSVLDVCAAPGGKSILFAERATHGLVVSSDFRPRRVALLKQQLELAGAAARVLAVDARQPLPFGATFDRVLLDAPCSGLGTLRRDPDLKWSRKPDDLTSFASAQLTMAVNASGVVRPGGALVYATCSSEPEENEDVVEAFLKQSPEFTLDRIDLDEPFSAFVTSRGFLQTRPDLHNLDAFFAAKLVRSRTA